MERNPQDEFDELLGEIQDFGDPLQQQQQHQQQQHHHNAELRKQYVDPSSLGGLYFDPSTIAANRLRHSNAAVTVAASAEDVFSKARSSEEVQMLLYARAQQLVIQKRLALLRQRQKQEAAAALLMQEAALYNRLAAAAAVAPPSTSPVLGSSHRQQIHHMMLLRRQQQLRKHPQQAVPEPCKFFAQGFCGKGNTCAFRHIPLPKIRNAKQHLDHPRKQQQQQQESLEEREEVKRMFASLLKLNKNNEDDTELLLIKDEPSLQDVKEKIFDMAKDQHGCRFLQKRFEERNPANVEMIFGEVVHRITELMVDPFGNYLVQKLVEVASDVQLKQILEVATKKSCELVDVCLNTHGTRAVQKLIEALRYPEQVTVLVSALKKGVVTLIKDLNGNHVIQRCLLKFNSEENQFIFEAAARHCVEIGTHRHGCCVLNRCFNYASGPQLRMLVAEVAANSLILSQDQYGNYVVQYVLDLPYSWASAEVIRNLDGSFTLLSMQKFSSNVVERCIKTAQPEQLRRIVQEMIGSPQFTLLLQDPFANYVIQSALSVAKGAVYAALIDAIRPHAASLRSSPYGKRVLSKTSLK